MIMFKVKYSFPLPNDGENYRFTKESLIKLLDNAYKEGLNFKKESDISSKVSSNFGLTPEALRNKADSVRDQIRQNDKKIIERALQAHIDYIVNNMFSAAEEGEYSIMSDNLCNQKYIEGLSWSLDEAENYLRKHLKRYFTEMGFSVEGEGNCVTISWEHKKTKK